MAYREDAHEADDALALFDLDLRLLNRLNLLLQESSEPNLETFVQRR